MDKRKVKNGQKNGKGSFFFHILLLIWLILFKLAIDPTEIPGVRDLNLILFRNSYYLNGKINFIELLFNIIVFIPVGIYLSILKPGWTFARKILVTAAISLAFEGIQFVGAMGYTDITDLANNTAGGIGGIKIYELLKKVWKDRTERVLNTMILGAEILLIVLYLGYRTMK